MGGSGVSAPDDEDTPVRRIDEDRTEPTVLLDLSSAMEPRSIDEWARGRLAAKVLERELSVSPALGPECLDEPEEADGDLDDGWKQGIYLDQHVIAVLRDGDEKRSTFFDEVVEQRLHGRRKIYITERDELDDAVSEVRLALFECAYRATALYSETWAAAPSPVTDWVMHEVLLNEHQLEEMTMLVERATRALHELPPRETGPRGDLYRLGARSLAIRLNTLLKRLAGTAPTRMYPEYEDGHPLQASVMEWLTDVFWHSMTFDSPCYPRMDELALQVSLVGTDRGVPIRRMEPAATTERENVLRFHGAVCSSVNRGFLAPRNLPARKLHAGLADVLHAQYAEWTERRRREQRKSPFPLAISTTFDLELERALAVTERHEGGAFHVAFPVIHVKSGNNRGNVRWIIGTFEVQEPDVTEDELRTALTHPRQPGWRWLEHETRMHLDLRLKGPLVLKVNGSPLHRLKRELSLNMQLIKDAPEGAEPDKPTGGGMPRRPRDAKARQQSRKLRAEPRDEDAEYVYHAPAIAEFDVLQFMHVDEWSYGARSDERAEVEQGMPRAITDELDNPRRFWLIAGQRLSDWSTRMQLFLHVSRTRVRGTSLSNALAVSRTHDRDRARLLDGLGIERAEGGDFERLAGALHEIADEVDERTLERR